MKNSYLLLTSAYNEEKYIGNTIEGVLKQSILPRAWYIISDCSNDNTDEIIQEYAHMYEFIHYERRNDDEKKSHNFASKVYALNSLLEKITLSDYSHIGILDADIIIPQNYYEELLTFFDKNESYGIIGGSVYEKRNGKLKLHVISTNTVGGAVQFFKMDCFSLMDRFLPMRYGGEDSMMIVRANYHGWKTKTLKELHTMEQKFVGRAHSSLLKARMNRGMGFYDMGYSLWFMCLKCLFRLFSRPYIVGSFAEFWGYLKLLLRREKRTAPKELVQFLRKEQRKRIFRFRLYR